MRTSCTFLNQLTGACWVRHLIATFVTNQLSESISRYHRNSSRRIYKWQKLNKNKNYVIRVSKMAYCITRTATQLSNKAAFSHVGIFNDIFLGNWNSLRFVRKKSSKNYTVENRLDFKELPVSPQFSLVIIVHFCSASSLENLAVHQDNIFIKFIQICQLCAL